MCGRVSKTLKELTIAEQEPQLLNLRGCFQLCALSVVASGVGRRKNGIQPCALRHQFEREFARFLDNAEDVKTFSKLPQPFGFSIDYTDSGMNLRSYYPDFVAIDTSKLIGFWKPRVRKI